MKFSQKDLEENELGYSVMLDWIDMLARLRKNELSLLSTKELQSLLSKEEIIHYLMLMHSGLMFSGNDELLTRLKGFKLEDNELRWFASINDIKEQFALIEKNGIAINKFRALVFIRIHLSFKFSNQILIWGEKHLKRDGTPMTILTKDLIDLNNRRKYAGGDPTGKLNNYKVALNGLLKKIEGHTEMDFKAFLGSSNAKTNKTILRNLIEECFDYSGLNQTQFFTSIYGLFQLFVFDNELMTEEQFIDRDILEDNFDTYRHSRIYSIIYDKQGK